MPHADTEVATPEKVLGRELRALREKLGWSQERVAQEMIQRGFPWRQSMAAKTEAAQRPVRVNELVALADIFKVSPMYLLANASDQERGAMFTELVATTSRIYRAQDQIAELQRHLAEAELELQTAMATRRALSAQLEKAQEGHADVEHPAED